MNSREKVLSAFEHRETGHFPVDLSGHRSSGISGIAYANLRDFLGLEKKPLRIYDPVQQLAVVDDDILEIFGVDVIELGRGFALDESDWHDWIMPDGRQCLVPRWFNPVRKNEGWYVISRAGEEIAKMPAGALYFEQGFFPFYNEEDLDNLPSALENTMWTSPALSSPPGPLAGGNEGRKLLREGALNLREGTRRAVIGLFGGSLFETGQFLYRNDNFLYKLAAEPGKVSKFLDRLVEIHLFSLEKYLEDVGDCIDIILFGDDLGMQTGPMISPEMYRKFFKPRHKKMWSRTKELSGAKIMLHCCGGIKELLPDFIEAGLDCINPVQTSCSGMSPEDLKREFGPDIVFWGGGCDTRSVLPHAQPSEIEKHVRRRLEIFGKGGGFVFQQEHNILSDVPPENIVAMFNAIKSQEHKNV